MARTALQTNANPMRTQLLDAAEIEFADAGFKGARLADIAARAGIRRPSLLYHFPSKEALYTSVVERTFALLGEVLAAAMAAARSFEERVEAPARYFADFLEGRPAAGRILLREVLDDHGPGRDILLKQGVPILATVEGFLRGDGAERIPDDFPLRAALMQSVANLLLWSAAGPLRESLWGGGHETTALGRAIWQLGPAPTE